MLTMIIAAMFFLSTFFFARVVFVALATILRTLKEVQNNQRLSGDFGGLVWRLTFASNLFIAAVILTLIRYGIFKL